MMRQLYMEEQRPLKEVMAVLSDDYGFKATVRSFKRRFAEWGWRKNIHLRQGEDDLAVLQATMGMHMIDAGSSPGSGDHSLPYIISPTPTAVTAAHQGRGASGSGPPGEEVVQQRLVRLSSGQVVDVERLAEHLRRKRQKSSQHGQARRLQHQHQGQRRGPSSSTMITTTSRPPDLSRFPRHSHHDQPPQVHYALLPDRATHAYEMLFTHSRDYTVAQHGSMSRMHEAALLLSRDRTTARRWADFADPVQDALVHGNVALALRRMRDAPRHVALMVRERPSHMLCSLLLFVLQLSSGWGLAASSGRESARGGDAGNHGNDCEEQDADGPADQFLDLLQALFRYATAMAADIMTTPHESSFPHIMRSLAMVSRRDLAEAAFRAWAVTCHAWTTIVSIDGVPTELVVPERCIRRWLEHEDKGNIMLVLSDVIESSSSILDAEAGRSHEKSIVALQHKADLVAWTVSEQGGDPYSDPGLITLYQEILDRGGQGLVRDKAVEFLAKSRGTIHEPVQLVPPSTLQPAQEDL